MKSEVFQTKVKLNPKEIVGSKIFNLTVYLKNLSSDKVYIEPLNLDQYLGEEVGFISSSDNSEIDELEREKIELISSLETNIRKMFLDNLIAQERRELFKSSIGRGVSRIIGLINLSELLLWSFQLLHQNFRQLPEDMRETTAIKDISHIDIFEKVIQESEFRVKPTLLTSFETNKEKLLVCLNKIKEKSLENNGNSLDLRYIPIPTKTEISFSYDVKLPTKFSDETVNFILSSRVVDEENKLKEKLVLEQEINVLPSVFAIPFGAFLGGLIGYFLKWIFLGYEAVHHVAWELLGISLFSIVISLFFRKLPNKKSKKLIPFTVDDLRGGFLIGVLSGIYTDDFFKYLEGIVPS